ncbi:MAG TPA: alkene reductase [Gemmatimonadaceae bacterium]
MTANANKTSAELLEPATLGTLKLRNRVVMAPMTRNRADARDAPQAMNVEYYRQRASAGLIVTEASQVSAQGKGNHRSPGIFTERQVDGWRAVTDAVHARGGCIFLQLWHCGRISHPVLQRDGELPVAPSAITPAGMVFTGAERQPFVAPRALAPHEIQEVVEQFGRGAANARTAGFDGVEIHAANGYLIDQFLRDGTNRRTDAWGGPVERRARLLLEVVEAVSSVWGSGRVGVRVSPINPFNDIHDSDPAGTFGYVARRLSRLGLAYLHVVESGPEPFDWGMLREQFQGTYMANGGYDRDRAVAALREGRAELISFGAPFIANPDLVERLRDGLPLAVGDRATFYGGDARGYIDYPRATAA